jgi:hypothetical protein
MNSRDETQALDLRNLTDSPRNMQDSIQRVETLKSLQYQSVINAALILVYFKLIYPDFFNVRIVFLAVLIFVMLSSE